MISRSILSDQITKVKTLGDQAVAEAQGGGENKLHLIQLRRLIVTTMDELITMSEAATELLPPEQAGEALKECRRLVNICRTTGANHLAKWPAVNIDKDKAGYTASAAEVARVYANFVDWARDSLLAKLSH
jgi:hypothetical protein